MVLAQSHCKKHGVLHRKTRASLSGGVIRIFSYEIISVLVSILFGDGITGRGKLTGNQINEGVMSSNHYYHYYARP